MEEKFRITTIIKESGSLQNTAQWPDPDLIRHYKILKKMSRRSNQALCPTAQLTDFFAFVPTTMDRIMFYYTTACCPKEHALLDRVPIVHNNI
jgi:hypothetical protein